MDPALESAATDPAAGPPVEADLPPEADLPLAAEAAPEDEAARERDRQLATWLLAIVDLDERALTALYDATVHRVYGFVRCIVRNDALAEEVVEDAYFQVWRQAVRYDGARGRPMTWLLAIARSRAIDALRHEARFAAESLDTEDAPAVADGTSPPADELLELARQHADLHQALLLLGPQPRQLVSLAFMRGLSHEEIADQMRLPLGTVKSQIRRALITLRDRLGAEPFMASAT